MSKPTLLVSRSRSRKSKSAVSILSRSRGSKSAYLESRSVSWLLRLSCQLRCPPVFSPGSWSFKRAITGHGGSEGRRGGGGRKVVLRSFHLPEFVHVLVLQFLLGGGVAGGSGGFGLVHLYTPSSGITARISEKSSKMKPLAGPSLSSLSTARVLNAPSWQVTSSL